MFDKIHWNYSMTFPIIIKSTYSSICIWSKIRYDQYALAALSSYLTDIAKREIDKRLTLPITWLISCLLIPQTGYAIWRMILGRERSSSSHTLRSVMTSVQVKYRRNSLACKMQEDSACNTGDSAKQGQWSSKKGTCPVLMLATWHHTTESAVCSEHQGKSLSKIYYRSILVSVPS